jgi:hypothetical protein
LHLTDRMESTLHYNRSVGQETGTKLVCHNTWFGKCGPKGTSLETRNGACGGAFDPCSGAWIAYGNHYIDLAPTGIWLIYDTDNCAASGPHLHCWEEWLIKS